MAKVVDFGELGMITVPAQTETYVPVSHQELVTRIKEAGTKHYGVSPHKEKLEVNHRGQQMFGSLTFHDGASMSNGSGMNRTIGFRNSYDKTLPIGLCGGASVMVCSNLMFVGDIINMRKHTQNVQDDLDVLIQKLFEDVDRRYKQAHEDAGFMKEIQFSDKQVGDYLGQLFVNEHILNGSQMNKAANEWFESPVFKERTLWSAYNACTEALKAAHPSNALEKYTKLHTFTEDYVLKDYKKHVADEIALLEETQNNLHWH
jgi:hypothetical protein